jgi:hypothetical protein
LVLPSDDLNRPIHFRVSQPSDAHALTPHASPRPQIPHPPRIPQPRRSRSLPCSLRARPWISNSERCRRRLASANPAPGRQLPPVGPRVQRREAVRDPAAGAHQGQRLHRQQRRQRSLPPYHPMARVRPLLRQPSLTLARSLRSRLFLLRSSRVATAPSTPEIVARRRAAPETAPQSRGTSSPMHRRAPEPASRRHPHTTCPLSPSGRDDTGLEKGPETGASPPRIHTIDVVLPLVSPSTFLQWLSATGLVARSCDGEIESRVAEQGWSQRAAGAVTCVRGRTPGRCAASCGGRVAGGVAWRTRRPYNL